MKKITSLLLAVLMLVAIIPTSVFASDNLTVTVGEKTIYADEGTVSIDITLANNPGIAVIGFKINYSSDAFKLESITNGSIFSNSEVGGNVDRTPFMFNAYNGEANKSGNGTLVTLNFSVKENAAAKKYDFKIQEVEVLNIDEDSVDYVANNGSVTLKNRSFTGITFAGAEYTYDGTAKVLSVSGAPADATVTYTCSNFDENGKAINAGTYNITATVKKDGYDDWTNTKTLTINPKALTITGLSAQDKIYDGTDTATLSDGTLSGKVGNDDVSATIPTEGKFADKNVGNNKAVTINTIALSGTKKDNYTLTQPTGLKASITKATVSVKAKDQKMKVGGTLPSFTYEKTGLIDGDTITGSLKTTTDGRTKGTFDIVEDEKFTAGNNYNVTFTKGTLTVSEKDNQKVTVSDIPTSKTYGDDPFTFTIADNETNVTSNITVTSSKPDVATVENNNGTVTVTIKNAGTTEIRVFRAGNDTYADFDESTTLTVSKKTLKIKAKSDTVKQSDTLALPTLDNTWWSLDESTPLAYTDTIENTISGTLKYAENATRKTIGTYAIQNDNLSAGDNYTIDFTEGTITVEPKTPQTITVADFETKTYGADAFDIVVTPDATSKLNTFTYTSDNTNVATISDKGQITIVGAGEANITVTQAGDKDYAATSDTKKLTVNPKSVTVKSIDLSEKTAVLEGVLEKDADKVAPDFDKIITTVVDVVSETDGGATTVTSTVLVENLNLTGDKANNYIVQETSIQTTVSKTPISEKLTEDDNTTIVAAPADDKTLVVTDITVTSEEETEEKTVAIDATGVGDNKIETIVLSKTAMESVAADTSLSVKTKDGNGNDATIVLNANAVSAIMNKANIGESKTISLSAVTMNKEELADKQAAKVDDTKSPVLYSITITNENGDSVAGDFGEDGTAKVTLSYTKPSGNGTFGVVCLNRDGSTTAVANPVYDSTNHTVTVTLSHFSIYMIYTEPERHTTGGGGGGGGGASTYTVKFETDGGSAIDSVKVDKNKTVAEPTAPTKDGFEFAGWYTDKELTTKYDFDTKVTKGITLYAAWTEKKAEVKDDNTDPTTPENKITFADVRENDWFCENVKYVVENGLMNGTNETEFAPNDNLTRAMLVTILYRAAGEPEVNKSIPFADVTADSYYANAVIWAQQNGIVSGVNENEFAPDENITREQIATIIYRYANYKGYDTSAKADISSFTDVSEISEYATEAMQYAVASGLIKGKTETTLNPQDNATRAEIAAILQRFIESNK